MRPVFDTLLQRVHFIECRRRATLPVTAHERQST